MFVLNTILYNPLITFMDERDDYILDNLNKASNLLKTAEELKIRYENDLYLTKQEAQQEILISQKRQKNTFDKEIEIGQSSIDKVVETTLNNLALKKTTALESLSSDIESLSNQILKRIFTARVKS
jgi:F0F1-type ATP synthase membrane subunit b/b'